VIGLVAISPSIGAALAGPLQNGGVFTMPTASWDAICGTSGGLTFNTVYYLSPTTAGFYTSVAPTTTGQFVVPVLVGLSPTQAQITLIPPIAL
jgi:hypothetical protein